MCYAFKRQYKTNFVPVMPTNLYGPLDNYDLLSSHVMPAMIRKFHLAKLATAGDNNAISNDSKTYGPIPSDFYVNLTQIAAANNHTLNGAGAAEKPDLTQIKASDTVNLWGTGTPKREFLYVDDLADALTFIMFNSQSTELLNIGTGIDQTINELAEAFDPTKPDGTPRKLLDISKLKTLGWKPKFTLEEGIKQAYESYKKL